MTERVHVDLGERSYNILIGNRLFDTIGAVLGEAAQGNQVLIAYDAAVASPWMKRLYRAISEAGFDVTVFEIPSGESSKNAAMVEKLWEIMADGDYSRDAALIALGGGVVGDLAGFAAATYLRGISYIHVPTTLLAMVDSSVGGKTGINLPHGKNLVGAFWQPRLVVADLDCLGTLPEEERNAGLAEVIKYGVIADAKFFEYLEENMDSLFDGGNHESLRHTIKRSVEIKAGVVTADERESGLRRILNFGHTIGHAIEAEGDYGRLRHGECVAIGMVAASLITLRRNKAAGWTPAEHERLVRLIERAKLPTTIPPDMSIDALIDRTRVDKKVRQGRVRYVLPKQLGVVEVVRDVDEDLVADVLQELGACC